MAKKTSKEIREIILNLLNDQPASIEYLRKNIDSNWSTINTHLNKLKEEDKVKEIYVRENLRLFSQTDYPVFYGLPLEKKKRDRSLYLLSAVSNEWKKQKNTTPSKTTVQKIAVEIARNNPSLNIPYVRFHYGETLSVHESNMNTYDVDENTRDKISQLVKKEIENKEHENIAWKEKRRQYENHEELKLFRIADDVTFKLSNKDDQGLLDKLNDFLLEMPFSEEYFMEKYDEFLNAVTFILNSKEFNDNKGHFLNEILDVFNSLWQALTTQFFFEDFERLLEDDFIEIKEEIRKAKINSCKFEIEEKLNYLEDYKNSLTPRELDKEEKEISKVLLEGADQE